MAAAIQKLHDHYLSCIICTELYTDPCTLACGHTFCRGCLRKYTKTQQAAIQAKSIPCPNCRQMTKVTNPGRSVEDWIEQIKPSFLIQGLVDDFVSQQGGNRDPGSLCFSCRLNDEMTPASLHCIDCDLSMCDKCVKVHRAMPTSSHHEFSGIGGEVKQMKRKKVRCKAHNNIIEFCCKDCSKAICPKCCILNHRKCEDVVTLESMVAEMKTTLRRHQDVLSEQEKKIKSHVRQKQRQIKETEAEKIQVVANITKVTQTAISLIKQKGRVLMDEVENITERRIGNLKGQVKAGEIDLQMYQQHCEFIDQVLTSESEIEMYEMLAVCQSGAIKTEVVTNLDDSSPMGQMMFVEEFQKEMICRNLPIGSIMILKDEVELNSTPALVDTVVITAETDRKSFDPIDVTVLDVNGTETLVVTDYNNKCLKSSYIVGNQTHHSKLQLSKSPRTVSKLNHNQIVVSFYEDNKIVIAKATPDLVLTSNITTENRYHCLTFLNDSTLVAGCGGVLHIVDMTGNVLKSLRPGKNMPPNPSFLCTTNNGNIHVTDSGSAYVYCLTPDGNVVFNYTPSGTKTPRSPRGITLCKTGDILMVESYQNKVVQLTPSGKFVRDVLTSMDGINNPRGICLHGHRLYVAQNHQLKVFRFNTRNQETNRCSKW